MKLVIRDHPAQRLEDGAQPLRPGLLAEARGDSVFMISSGDTPADRRPIADRFGVGKEQVKLADAETVLRLISYPAGGVPPFGHAAAVAILLDRAVLAWDVIYGGGGDDHTLLRIAPVELERVTEAKWVDL
jgi:prolyl-tRNA editing enzyme YbaK/EbsC (Cys-tRNA(Pro) deacylase)